VEAEELVSSGLDVVVVVHVVIVVKPPRLLGQPTKENARRVGRIRQL
jgi:hypothetical protein